MSTQAQILARPVICGRCGAVLRPGQSCAECGQRPEPTVGVPDGWRGPWTPAGAASVVGGVAIDVLVAAAAGTAAWFAGDALQVRSRIIWVLAVAVALLVLALLAHRVLRRGRALGHRLVRARLLDAVTGLPPARLRALAGDGARWVSTAGVDPLHRLGLAPSTDQSRDTPQDRRPGGATIPTATPTVTLSDGTRTPIGARLLVGRYPMEPEDGVTMLQVTDLTRTLGRRHLELAASPDGSVTATDLGSANGTTATMAGPGGQQTLRLEPRIATTLALPCTLVCGDQVLAVSHEAAPRGSARASAPAATHDPATPAASGQEGPR